MRARAGRVELLCDGAQVAAPFDHVFVACAPDDLEHPLSGVLRDSGPFTSTRVYSAIWRGTGWPERVASRCYLASSLSGERARRDDPPQRDHLGTRGRAAVRVRNGR